DLERFQHVVPVLCRTTEAAIFDRREHKTETEILGQQRHRLVHGIRWMILWGRRRDDPAIVQYRQEHPKLNQIHPPLHDSQRCLAALGPGRGLMALREGVCQECCHPPLSMSLTLKTIRCWSMTGTMTVVIKVLSRDRKIVVKMAES